MRFFHVMQMYIKIFIFTIAIIVCSCDQQTQQASNKNHIIDTNNVPQNELIECTEFEKNFEEYIKQSKLEYEERFAEATLFLPTNQQD